jgi:hypothetical protein
MTELAASAGASDGRVRGNGTAPLAAGLLAAGLLAAGLLAIMARMLGRCRGSGIGPRIGSSAGRTSAAAMRGGGGGGGSRDAPKSGALVAFGLGQAIPRSEELGALVEAALSADRGNCGTLGAAGMAAVVELPADTSPVVVAVIAEGAPDEPLAAVDERLASGSDVFLSSTAGPGPSPVGSASACGIAD